MENNKQTNRYVEIFAPYIRKNGRIYYPKNSKYFHFWIKVK